MTPLLGKDAVAGVARAGEYARHQPEQTLLYQLVEACYPAFVEHLAARERALPAHVVREFEAYLKCGRLEHGFLRVRCADCHAERLVASARAVARGGWRRGADAAGPTANRRASREGKYFSHASWPRLARGETTVIAVHNTRTAR